MLRADWAILCGFDLLGLRVNIAYSLHVVQIVQLAQFPLLFETFEVHYGVSRRT